MLWLLAYWSIRVCVYHVTARCRSNKCCTVYVLYERRQARDPVKILDLCKRQTFSLMWTRIYDVPLPCAYGYKVAPPPYDSCRISQRLEKAESDSSEAMAGARFSHAGLSISARNSRLICLLCGLVILSLFGYRLTGRDVFGQADGMWQSTTLSHSRPRSFKWTGWPAQVSGRRKTSHGAIRQRGARSRIKDNLLPDRKYLLSFTLSG
jgi:hypothetical protein